MAKKLTKNDIDKIIPQMERKDAIKQIELFNKEFEKSKEDYKELIKKIDQSLIN